MDRNRAGAVAHREGEQSLSARRAWIEIWLLGCCARLPAVALRKESVDRNAGQYTRYVRVLSSLSARRAWIEI